MGIRHAPLAVTPLTNATRAAQTVLFFPSRGDPLERFSGQVGEFKVTLGCLSGTCQLKESPDVGAASCGCRFFGLRQIGRFSLS